MTRNELQTLCNKARQYKSVNRSGKSDVCIMVLELMDTAEYSHNYCASLREVLGAFPEVNRAELERELDKYI